MKIAIKIVVLSAVLLGCSPLYADTVPQYITTNSGTGYTAASDPDINSALLIKIANDSTVASLNVSISTHNGMVSLTGTLTSEDAAAQFIALAMSTQGVKDVDTSQLKLTGGIPLSINLILTAKVKGALIRGKAFGEATLTTLPITITTNNGIVYLKGIVDSQAQMIYAIKIAQAVPGVPRVISMLTVKVNTVRVTG